MSLSVVNFLAVSMHFKGRSFALQQRLKTGSGSVLFGGDGTSNMSSV